MGLSGYLFFRIKVIIHQAESGHFFLLGARLAVVAPWINRNPSRAVYTCCKPQYTLANSNWMKSFLMMLTQSSWKFPWFRKLNRYTFNGFNFKLVNLLKKHSGNGCTQQRREHARCYRTEPQLGDICPAAWRHTAESSKENRH